MCASCASEPGSRRSYSAGRGRSWARCSGRALGLALLREIAAQLQGPLVLHGGSGVSASDLVEAGRSGVVKLNIGSALCRALRRAWPASGSARSHRGGYANTRAAAERAARAKLRALRGEPGEAGV